jgi:N-carbamoyl-L-amino-acid hydrolase
MGSHIDSVPEGGKYDGCVGSLGAIEVVQTLVERGIRTRHPIEILIFQNEEGGLVGSRPVNGELGEAELKVTNASGRSRREGIAFIGGDPDALATARRKAGAFAAYLELHIEQGGILDEKNLDIGVVEGIVGIGWWRVTVEGDANHAGTTPMNRRKDALVAAARFVDAATGTLETRAAGHDRRQLRVERTRPTSSRVGADARDPQPRSDEDAALRRRASVSRASRPKPTRFNLQPIDHHDPSLADDNVRHVIDATARTLGLATLSMPSKTKHDAQSIARLAPMGMIFIPARAATVTGDGYWHPRSPMGGTCY